LVPALFLCEKTVPRLDVDDPILATEKVAGYWEKIQSNEFASKILDEMARGMQARLDGTERKFIEAAIAKEKEGGN
jgi:hypothetical protein